MLNCTYLQQWAVNKKVNFINSYPLNSKKLNCKCVDVLKQSRKLPELIKHLWILRF